MSIRFTMNILSDLIIFLFSSIIGCASISQKTAFHHPDLPVVKITAVGDTNGYNISLNEDPLKGIGELAAGSDIFIFNAEGVFSSKPLDNCHGFPPNSIFFSFADVLDFLKKGEMNIASLANNHILDCDPEGIRVTIRELKTHGIIPVGAGGNLSEACAPLELKINGINMAIVSYLSMEGDLFYADNDKAGAASWERCDGQKQIRELRDKADIVLAILHLHHGTSWTGKSHQKNIDFVQNILDAGADLVISSGPHVPQGVMKRGNGIALMSLGNFLFRPDYQMPEKARRSIFAEVTVTEDTLKLTITPLKLGDSGTPELSSQVEALRILDNVFIRSYALGTIFESSGGKGYFKVKRKPKRN